MRSRSLIVVLLLLGISHVALSQDAASMSVGLGEGGGGGEEEEEEGWGEVGGNALNPCNYASCEPGMVCVPIVNDLLQLPVAHCVEKIPEGKEGEDDPCSSFEVGVSMVACRTEAQWRDVAGYRCASKRGGEHVDVQVRHPCHRRHSQSPSIFLQATISCCPPHETEAPPTSTDAPPTTPSDGTEPPSIGYDQVGEDVETEETGDKEKLEEEEEEEEEEEKEKEESRRDVGLVVVAAVAGCIALVVGTIATARLYRRKKERRSTVCKPRLEFITAYINPSSEGWGEGGTLAEKSDLSYVVTNKNTSSGSG